MGFDKDYYMRGTPIDWRTYSGQGELMRMEDQRELDQLQRKADKDTRDLVRELYLTWSLGKKELQELLTDLNELIRNDLNTREQARIESRTMASEKGKNPETLAEIIEELTPPEESPKSLRRKLRGRYKRDQSPYNFSKKKTGPPPDDLFDPAYL
jgi:hypothetical protein